MMAAIDGISIYIEGPRDDLEKLVTHSCYWLAAGIAGIAMLIPATLFKTNTIAYILSIPTLLFTLVLALKYDNISIHKSKTNQPSTEVEEQLKCTDKENST
ncbi:hypothetical protein FXV91_07920 [Methanosarcina sp. DH2]|uniref:hypothetical protein n=1 Tax=Methanosarcina sp. DH2 TaxID=2605639 RepID=UPI001E516CD6|nr:hypothetical protein [Methanosarcina sp. DH2]MCC4770123.1 hypothetical protein [Methanosarcina sp. DH2]